MTFIIWIAAAVFVVVLLVVAGKRSKPVVETTEKVAQEALPAIGAIAERQHTLRFGRPPTNTPGRAGASDSWYPKTKKRTAQKA